MSLKIFSQAPYHDDYDADKRYLRMLFRPGVSLQVRELNQLQTYLQTQIERLGLHLFKDGSMVIPGQTAIDTKMVYLKLEAETNGVEISTILSQLVGNTITGANGATAQIITYSDAEDTDPITLFVRYTASSETDSDVKAFVAGELLTTAIDGEEYTLQILPNNTPIGLGSIASIEAGIYFIKSQFVQVDSATIILNKYSSAPSYRIGLLASENIITSNSDATLNDNANGSPNENAPGAHRYQLLLTFTKLAINSETDENFIELLRIENGELKSKVETTTYSELAKTLARRTYDESGNYTVRPFKFAIREHRNNDRGEWAAFTAYEYGDIVTSGGNYYIAMENGTSGTVEPDTTFAATNPYQILSDGNITWNYTNRPPFNRGYKRPEDGGNETSMAVAIEPGKGYVQGYEIEKIATEFLEVPKSRDFNRIDSDAVNIKYGNYIYVTNVHGVPDCTTLPTIKLYDQMSPSTNIQVGGAGNQIGTAKIRAFEFDSGTPGRFGVYKAYLFDVNVTAGYTLERDLKQIFFDSGTTLNNLVADVVDQGQYPTLSGTISVSSTTVTGVGTQFQTELRVGDYIQVEDSAGDLEERRVTSITNNTTLAVASTFSGTITGKSFKRVMAKVQDPSYTGLLFPLAWSFIRKVRGGENDNVFATAYTTTQKFTGSTSSGQTSLTISVGAASGATTLGAEFNPSANKNEFIVINRTTGLPVNPSSITLTNNDTDAVIAGLAQSSSYTVLAPVRKAGSIAQEKKKTLVPNAVKDFTSAATVSPTKLSLGKADGYRLVAVLMKNSGFVASSDPTEVTDITDWYTFDDGQTETHYDVATITRKDGYPVPTGAVRVIFDYFSHTTGNAGDYFTVDSYSVPYNKIPYFTYAGGIIALTDVMDFRPRIDDTGADYSSTGSSRSELPKVGFETVASYSYHVARRDKLALDIDGKFFTVSGAPSNAPQEPKDPELGMLLAKLNVSPYTLFPDKGSVSVEVMDTKRYTMRDIGKLDKRIENLEYYTSLSLLENDTKTLAIKDEVGLERFKNGFIVDNFKGQDLGDVTSVDYRCAIDMTAQELRPFYTMDNVNLVEENQLDSDRTADGYQLTGDIISLPYTHLKFIDQPFASRTENVNPFAVFTFLGQMSLNPPTDDWFETDRRPDIINNIEGNFSAVQTQLQNQGALGTVWGAWETSWTGATRNIDRLVVTRGFDSTNFGLGAGRWMDRRTFTAAELQAIGGDATSFGNGAAGSRVLTFQTQATTVGQARQGITTSVVPKVDYEVIGDKVLQTAVVPYIRARELLFVCRGLKPNTRLNAFFDDVNIASFCTPATRLPITQNGSIAFDTETNAGAAASDIGRQLDGKPEVGFNKGDVVYVKQRGTTTYNSQVTAPARGVAVLTEKATDTGAEAVYLLNISGTFQGGDIIQGSLSGATYIIQGSGSIATATKGSSLVTNFNGNLAGVFSIPNTDAARFRTGVREFKLSDSTSAEARDFTTQGRAQYRAQGVIETKQRTINAVRNADIVTQPASQTRTQEIFSPERIIRDTGWYDPLAQTFMVASKGGAFITKVDVYFSTKDANIPVNLQIRESVNGYPGPGILPFSKCTYNPDRINTSNDASVPTTFTFESPVYVNDETEYCIVLLSDSNNYRVWISQLGEKNVGTDRFISEQPYAGVLFKSQNASTWTANQEQDLKFTIYRANFATNTEGVVTFNNDILPPAVLDRAPFKTTNGSPLVRVSHRNHGMPSGSTVIITNVADGTYNGIATTESSGLNGEFTIQNPEADSYVINVGTNANATGFVGDENVVVTENVGVDAIQLTTTAQTFSDTTLSYGMITTDTTYTPSSVEDSIVPNDTVYFNSPKLVASTINEVNSIGLDGEKSLKVVARLSSTNNALSPIIDTSRLSATCIKNKIDNFTFTSKNVIGLDDIKIADAVTNITFDSGSPTKIFIPSASRGAARSAAVGKYIAVSGTTSNNTSTPVRITEVATDGSYIATTGAFTTESPTTCTLTLKDNYVAEDAPIGGSASAKYLTRLINLETPSSFLKIMFAANVPAVTDSDIEVWYKCIPTGTNGDIAQYPFVRATNPVKPIRRTSNQGEFVDVEYELSDLDAFDGVVVKLVFKGANTAQVPRVKDLRVIACA